MKIMNEEISNESMILNILLIIVYSMMNIHEYSRMKMQWNLIQETCWSSASLAGNSFTISRSQLPLPSPKNQIVHEEKPWLPNINYTHEGSDFPLRGVAMFRYVVSI